MLLPSEIALSTTDPDERALLKMWLALKLPMEVSTRREGDTRIWLPMAQAWYEIYLRNLTYIRLNQPDLVFRLKP